VLERSSFIPSRYAGAGADAGADLSADARYSWACNLTLPSTY
jgi:hypothetical protein